MFATAAAAASFAEFFVSLVASDNSFRHPMFGRWCGVGWWCADCCAVRARQSGEVILLGGGVVAGWLVRPVWSVELMCGLVVRKPATV